MSKSLITPILFHFHNLIFDHPITSTIELFELNNASALGRKILIEVLSTKIKKTIAKDNR